MSIANPYMPRPGTLPYRVIAWFETQPPGTEAKASQLADALGVDVNNVLPCLAPAVEHGALLRYTKNGLSKPNFYALPGRTNPKPTKGDQPRFERGREGMEPQACESASGQGTNGPPALATLPHYDDCPAPAATAGRKDCGGEGHAEGRSSPPVDNEFLVGGFAPVTRTSGPPVTLSTNRTGKLREVEPQLRVLEPVAEIELRIKCRSLHEAERIEQFVRQMREVA